MGNRQEKEFIPTGTKDLAEAQVREKLFIDFQSTLWKLNSKKKNLWSNSALHA